MFVEIVSEICLFSSMAVFEPNIYCIVGCGHSLIKYGTLEVSNLHSHYGLVTLLSHGASGTAELSSITW